ncbi:nucleotide exchange factor GrpE [Calothrix sp. 336/3]|uniref:nucleotide exchange factor GrpE n=1 Tax=Calothrix sp. 336/3 TaxID=1337936 RepID=UPI0004E310CF|nr:nucleotide exchange factor GrpE [Calothrix sp. 336/3]
MDEDKQVHNADAGKGEATEVKQTMNSDSPVSMNPNEPNTEVTEAVTSTNSTTTDSSTANVETPSPAGVDAAVVGSMTQQIESLKAQLEERSNQYTRMAADFENYRKRTQKEKEDLESQIKRNTIIELLPVVDNFERARSQIKPQNDGEMGIHKSYQGVYKQLVDCLKRVGVSPMRPEGQEFDPNLHEAVMREPTDEYPEGTVLEELVRGYFLGDRVLRHAMVKVAAPKEESSPSEETQSPPAES